MQLISDYERLPDAVAELLENRGAHAAIDALGHDRLVSLDPESGVMRMPPRLEEERTHRLADYLTRTNREPALRAALDDLEDFAPRHVGLYIGYQATRCAAVAAKRIDAELAIYRWLEPPNPSRSAVGQNMGSIERIQELLPLLRRVNPIVGATEPNYRRHGCDGLRVNEHATDVIAWLHAYAQRLLKERQWPSILGVREDRVTHSLSKNSALGALATLICGFIGDAHSEEYALTLAAEFGSALLRHTWSIGATRACRDDFIQLRILQKSSY
jgi:hypothetical protein